MSSQLLGLRLILANGTSLWCDAAANRKGYSSTCLAMGLASVWAGTRVPARTLANPMARKVLEYPFVLYRRCDAATHADVWAAARVGLGALGVVVEARCWDKYGGCVNTIQ